MALGLDDPSECGPAVDTFHGGAGADLGVEVSGGGHETPSGWRRMRRGVGGFVTAGATLEESVPHSSVASPCPFYAGGGLSRGTIVIRLYTQAVSVCDSNCTDPLWVSGPKSVSQFNGNRGVGDRWMRHVYHHSDGNYSNPLQNY